MSVDTLRKSTTKKTAANIDSRLPIMAIMQIREAIAYVRSFSRLSKEEVIRHVVEKQKDEYKFQVESTFGKPDNRNTVKVKGDDLDQVLADVKKAKEFLL